MNGLPLGTFNGVAESLHFDDAEDTFTIRREHDAQAIIDANKAWQADAAGWSPSRELRRIASIPPLVVEVWKQTYGVDPTKPAHHDLLRRLLNDPDNRFLRVSEGGV